MKKIKFVIQSVFNSKEVDIEDGGCAKIITLTNENEDIDGLFLRVHSWIDNPEIDKHIDFDKFLDRKVKITIETID